MEEITLAEVHRLENGRRKLRKQIVGKQRCDELVEFYDCYKQNACETVAA